MHARVARSGSKYVIGSKTTLSCYGRRADDIAILRAAAGLPITDEERAWIRKLFDAAVEMGKIEAPPPTTGQPRLRLVWPPREDSHA